MPAWNLACACILAAVLVQDATQRRIANGLSGAALALGLSYWTVTAQAAGLRFALLGGACGLGCGLLPYILGWCGAADSKLLAALGSWLGWQHLLACLPAVALIGGVLSLACLGGQPLRWEQALARARRERRSVPYSWAIVLGALFEVGWSAG